MRDSVDWKEVLMSGQFPLDKKKYKVLMLGGGNQRKARKRKSKAKEKKIWFGCRCFVFVMPGRVSKTLRIWGKSRSQRLALYSSAFPSALSFSLSCCHCPYAGFPRASKMAEAVVIAHIPSPHHSDPERGCLCWSILHKCSKIHSDERGLGHTSKPICMRTCLSL